MDASTGDGIDFILVSNPKDMPRRDSNYQGEHLIHLYIPIFLLLFLSIRCKLFFFTK